MPAWFTVLKRLHVPHGDASLTPSKAWLWLDLPASLPARMLSGSMHSKSMTASCSTDLGGLAVAVLVLRV